jgi:hypothetical protein
MKKYSIIIALLMFGFTCFSQRPFDKALKNISNDLASKLKLQDKEKVVVLFITDIKKTVTSGGKYLADIISYNLVNDTVFKVFERDNLSMIAEAKELIDEGYVTVEKSKTLGKLLSVNAIIVGTYTIFDNTVKLSLKALSTYNGASIAASMMDLPLDVDAGVLFGIKILSPGENASRNPNCKEKNTGDYCFQNSTRFSIIVDFWSSPSPTQSWSNKQTSTLQSGQTQCFYDLYNGAANYELISWKGGQSLVIYNDNDLNYQAKGSLYVEPCKEKTFIIK